MPTCLLTSAEDAPAPATSRRRWNTRPGTNRGGGGDASSAAAAGADDFAPPRPSDAPKRDASDPAAAAAALAAPEAASAAAPATLTTLPPPPSPPLLKSFAAAAAANAAPFSAAAAVRFCKLSAAPPTALLAVCSLENSFSKSFSKLARQSMACRRARRSCTFASDARDTTSSWSTTEVRNDAHDSAASKSRHGGVANATQRNVGMFCRMMAAVNAAVPAPRLCPNTVKRGFFLFLCIAVSTAMATTSLVSATIQRAAAAIPRCARKSVLGPSLNRGSASQSMSVSASLRLAVPRITRWMSPVASSLETKYAGCWNLLSGLDTTTTCPSGAIAAATAALSSRYDASTATHSLRRSSSSDALGPGPSTPSASAR